MIRCVVFDFDGTLVLSNEIKRQGFLTLAAQHPGGLPLMEEILSRREGDRYAIWQDFSKHTQVEASVLTKLYGKWVEDQILACPFRRGAPEILGRIRDLGLSTYINSATPEGPLRTIVAKKLPEFVFDGVFGGHGNKVANLRAILTMETISSAELLMVGDGTDDQEAAVSIGCAFAGVAEGTLAMACHEVELLNDLAMLEPHWLQPKVSVGCQ